MSAIGSKPTYFQTLQNARSAARSGRVLSSLWRHPKRWPSGGSKMIFCAEAVNRVGRMQFGSDWSGDEAEAYRYVYAFPDFAETLADFQHDLGDLVEIVAKYRRQYDIAKAKSDQFSRQNSAALDRLTWTCNWLAEKAREGHLPTFLRLVDSAERGAIYEPAYDGLWNNEDILETRFRDAGVGFGYDSEEKYIFFDLRSFENCLRDIRIFEAPSEIKQHLSPFMQLMLRAIEVHGITSENQPKHEILRMWFEREWREDRKLAPRLLSAMATFVRDVESMYGRARK